jgi:hypothetical protein
MVMHMTINGDMSTKTARVIILMAPEDKAALFELAQGRSESVGATVRALVEAERASRPKTERTWRPAGEGAR